MKLLNKLIPVASLASIAAIVTPLATSCGQVSNSITYNFKFERKSAGSEPTVPFNTYITQFEPAEPLFDGGIDEDTAWQLYFDKLEHDPSVFADDFLYGASDYWRGYIQVYSDLLLYKGNLDVTLKSFDRENKRFSWSIVYVLNYQHLSLGSIEEHKAVEKVSFNNFPCNLTQHPSKNWLLHPVDDLEILSDDKDFSVDLELDANIDGMEVSSAVKIDCNNVTQKFYYYFMEADWKLEVVPFSSFIVFANFGFCRRPLHYLINNPSKE